MKYEVKKISVIAGAVRKIGEIVELDEKKASKYIEAGFIEPGVIESEQKSSSDETVDTQEKKRK